MKWKARMRWLVRWADLERKAGRKKPKREKLPALKFSCWELYEIRMLLLLNCKIAFVS